MQKTKSDIVSNTFNSLYEPDVNLASSGSKKDDEISSQHEDPAKHGILQKRSANTVLMNTPKRKRRANLTMSSMKKKGGKLLRKNLTPPRNMLVGCGKTPKRNKKDPLTLSTTFFNAKSFEVRSCEHDPSDFQVEIPSHESVLASCKVCSIMDDYVEKEGVNFDLSSLMPWLKKNGSALQQSEQDKTAEEKSSVLTSLQSISNDIVVEGFFREFYTHENSDSGLQRVEACVFSSDKLRSFIVCYRGSSDLQDRPLQGSSQAQSKCIPTSDKKPPQSDVNIDVKTAYNTSLENSVFTLLDRLTALKPFCDVVITGHSFGATIATCAAMNYSKSHPSLRVFCQLFGSPLIGGQTFKNEAHSLPNLNIIRVERKSDPYVSLPEGSEWSHIGHTIRINPTSTSTFPITKGADDSKVVEFKCYRFDKNRPATNFVKSKVKSLSNFTKLKIGNEIKSYLKDLEKVNSLSLGWVDTFVGEEGTGVCPDDVRYVV